MSGQKSAFAIPEQDSNTAKVKAGPAGPALGHNAGKRADNTLTRRVEAALDADFANGSMPA